MRCFEHSNREAVGACIGCGKGICLDCLNRIQGKIYCDSCLPQSTGLRPRPADSLQIQMPAKDTLITLTTERNRYIAAILAFTLGTFGVHKLYVGQMGWFIIYLLFSWTGIPSLAGMVEAVLYLARPEDDFVRRYGRPLELGPVRPQRPLLKGGSSLRPSSKMSDKEYERFLLTVARQNQGQISLAHVLSEYQLPLKKVEAALARLTSQGIVQSELDDSGHVRYFVSEFLE